MLLLAESTRGVGTAWPGAAFRGGPGNVNDCLVTLLAEKHFAATRDIEFFQRHRVEIGLNAVTFGGGAIDFIAAAIDFRLAHCPAFLDELCLEHFLRLPGDLTPFFSTYLEINSR